MVDDKLDILLRTTYKNEIRAIKKINNTKRIDYTAKKFSCIKEIQNQTGGNYYEFTINKNRKTIVESRI